MRMLARALRQVRLLRGGHVLQHRSNKVRKVLILSAPSAHSSSSPYYNKEAKRCSTSSRNFLNTAATDCTGDAVEVAKAGPLLEYERRIASGELVDGDDFQVDTLRVLQRLYEELVENEDVCKLDRYKASEKSGRSRWLWSRFIPQFSQSPVKGLYLYGGVGTGKTMLMDLFYGQLPCNWRKKRIHFHDFMLNVHTHLQMHKGVEDPLEAVAAEISDESILLCLDEFMVNDVADALILNRLFKHLFDKGVVLVSTSNRAPDNLYEGGLQRDLFLPFIATLKERCVIHEIGSSTDYRRMNSAEHGFYFVGNEHSELLKQKFNELIGDAIPGPQIVDVPMGRQLQVPLGAKGCAYFPFEDFVTDPCRQLTTLACLVMYENKARLLCTAEASPVELFEKIVTVGEAQKISPRSSSRSEKNDDIDLCVDNDIGFVKDRTINRLTEMNSKEYMEQFDAKLHGGSHTS